MSRKAGTAGAGGYGGISTMNQDARQGRFQPHKSISKYLDRMENVWHIECLVCRADWAITDKQYFDRELGDMPLECGKNVSR